MKIIKYSTYNVVSNEPFDIPLPIEFELMHSNHTLASYLVHEDGQIDYQYSKTLKEPILTSTIRNLSLSDIYFLFASRVFPDKTPMTDSELERFGVKEYNPYEILRRTHGILPNDRYWIKFAGEDFNYKKVVEDYAEYFDATLNKAASFAKAEEKAKSKSEKKSAKSKDGGDSAKPIYSVDSILEQKSNEFSSINDVNSILSGNKLDVQSLISNIDDEPITESKFAPATKKKKSKSDAPAKPKADSEASKPDGGKETSSIFVDDIEIKLNADGSVL